MEEVFSRQDEAQALSNLGPGHLSMRHQFKRHDPHTVPRTPETLGQEIWPRVTLEIVRGRAQNRFRPVTDPAFLLGSAVDCDLVLGAARFPEVYAYLLLHENEVSIRHLGFVPELRVNGKSITKSVLQDGDQIEMGPYVMRVHVETHHDELSDTDEAIDDLTEIDEPNIESQVDALLDDIRATFFPDMQHLRLYVESKPTSPEDMRSNGEMESPGTKRRASGG